MLFPATTFLLFSFITTTAFAAPSNKELNTRQLSSTRNELSGACKDVTVIFARGTTEIGNVGTVVGPPFFSSLSKALGSSKSLAVQGVDYPADVSGFLAGGSPQGASNMAQHVQTVATKCPNTKIVLSGYSQGAQVTHKAAKQISTSLHSRIAAIVVFGDPNNGAAFPGILNNNVKTFCNRGDLICSGQSLILAPHLRYGSDAGAAAQFVVARV